MFRANQVKKAILYGSYGKNCADKESDVDIIVDSGLRGLSFYGLVNDVQLALAKKVHVYDTYYLRNTPIDEIIQSGVTIYER